jgi:hypothetical protein
VSETASRGREAGQQQADAVADGEAQEARRRGQGRRAVAVVGLVVLGAAAGVAAAESAGVSHSHGSSGSGQGGPPPATAPVVRRDLSSQTPVNATLGYAASYTVRGQGGGTLTWLPSAGQVIRQGQVLYKVDNGDPVVLLYGPVPAWRTLYEGLTGSDVTQLNHDLVALGYASSPDISAQGWDYYSWETTYGVQRLQSALGISYPPGSLSLGSVVFQPEALRVGSLQASLGSPVAAGPVLTATSARHAVTISLDVSQQTEVKAGDAVTVMLPQGSTTPGVISSVGTVASRSGSSATIPVYVSLTHPSATGSLDQAPVTVEITVGTVHNALVVPVVALLAQVKGGGGYAVEVVRADGSRHLVPVTVGIFDDSDGLVQVSGPLAPGQHVVVPAK